MALDDHSRCPVKLQLASNSLSHDVSSKGIYIFMDNYRALHYQISMSYETLGYGDISDTRQQITEAHRPIIEINTEKVSPT